MLGTLTLLLSCQLAGELTARLLHLPVPGPVLGMILLFIGLLVRGSVPAPLQETRAASCATCRFSSFRRASG